MSKTKYISYCRYLRYRRMIFILSFLTVLFEIWQNGIHIIVSVRLSMLIRPIFFISCYIKMCSPIHMCLQSLRGVHIRYVLSVCHLGEAVLTSHPTCHRNTLVTFFNILLVSFLDKKAFYCPAPETRRGKTADNVQNNQQH
jgi:hypothetical protein